MIRLRAVALLLTSASAVAGLSLGPADEAAAEAGAAGGISLFRADSEPGDYVGQGEHYLVTEAQAHLYLNGTANFIEATVNDAGLDWRLFLRNPAGRTLPLGVTATDDSSSDRNVWEMKVTGKGRGCASGTGSIDVKQLVLTPSGNVARFHATFTQTCRFDTGKSMSGEFAYHTTDAVAAPHAPYALRAGRSLVAGQSLTKSVDWARRDRLVVGGGGLTLVRDEVGVDPRELWRLRPSGGADRLHVSADGAIVLSCAGRVTWRLRPAGSGPGAFLVLRSDGRLVLYSRRYRALWSTPAVG